MSNKITRREFAVRAAASAAGLGLAGLANASGEVLKPSDAGAVEGSGAWADRGPQIPHPSPLPAREREPVAQALDSAHPSLPRVERLLEKPFPEEHKKALNDALKYLDTVLDARNKFKLPEGSEPCTLYSPSPFLRSKKGEGAGGEGQGLRHSSAGAADGWPAMAAEGSRIQNPKSEISESPPEGNRRSERNPKSAIPHPNPLPSRERGGRP